MGLIFILFGSLLASYSYFSKGWIDISIIILCALLVVVGILLIRRARKWGVDL